MSNGYHAAAMLQVFILLHTVDDREVGVNAGEIVSITKPGGLVTQDANCMLAFTDGKFLMTVETCKEVIDKLKEAK